MDVGAADVDPPPSTVLVTDFALDATPALVLPCSIQPMNKISKMSEGPPRVSNADLVTPRTAKSCLPMHTL